MPPPTRPPLAPPQGQENQESQESQDEYGSIDLDFDDPDLLAALGEVQSTVPINFRSKETALKKVRPIADCKPESNYKRILGYRRNAIVLVVLAHSQQASFRAFTFRKLLQECRRLA